MIRAQDQDIQSLVADIRHGKLLLPEMQRRYVWKAVQVRDLFDSLYHEYPSGQLLVWETDELPASQNRQASVEGLATEQHRPQLLLDGQQRLTSLTAVMLGQDLLVRDTSKSIDIAFNVSTEIFEVAGPRQRALTGWISLKKLFTEGAMSVFIELDIDHKSPQAKEVLERINRLDNIKKYKYRVNVLERLSYAEVTHIFVRTNSGGTTLGYADLALAQVSSSWRGVTKELEQYQEHLKRKGIGLELDNGQLLRAIVVILTGQSRFIRFFRVDKRDRDNKKNVTVDELKMAWERAKNALDQSISFLMYNCMIDRLEMLPTHSVLMPLVAFFDRYGNDTNDIQLRELQRWVYMALIWSRYSTSSETAMDQDIAALEKEHPIQEMIHNIENQVGKRPVTEQLLRDQRKNSPYMLMAYVLARRAHAQDWFSGVVVGNTHTPDYPQYHHIFPKSLLSKHYKLREESRIVDQVANLVLLTAPISKSMAKSLPSEYLAGIDEQRLKAQYIPLQRDLWQIDTFEEFMLQRRTMLADAINQLFLSLTEDKRIWVTAPVDMLEMRIDSLEHQLRFLLVERLTEARGEGAWDQLVSSDIRNSVRSRIKKEEENKPYTAGQHETLEDKLKFCLFSDLIKLIRANWVLFQDVFGKEALLEQYSNFAVSARNSIKHGNDLSNVDLAPADAGLLWLEECLHRVKATEESEEAMAEAIV